MAEQALDFIRAGEVLASAGTAQSGFQDALFGSGVVLWVVGVFGAVYGIVYRVAGSGQAGGCGSVLAIAY